MQFSDSIHTIQPDNVTLDINFKGFLNSIKRFKKSVLMTVLLTTLLAGLVAYFSPNIYKVESLIQIPNKNQGLSNDFMMMALGKESSDIEDEITIFKSRDIIQKTLNNLNFKISYYTKNNLKMVELYKDSPILVTVESVLPIAENIRFQVIPLDNKQFRLLIKPTLKTEIISKVQSTIASITKDKQPIHHDKIYNFEKKISTPWFTITIQRILQFDKQNYSFIIFSDIKLVKRIRDNLDVYAYSNKDNYQGNIIALDYNDNVALRAKEFLDALTDAYIQEKLDLKSESAEKKLNFIDKQLGAINETLKGSSNKLQDYKSTHIVVNIDSKAQLTSEKLSELESQLYEINMKIDILQNILNYINTHKDIRGINIDSVLDIGGNSSQFSSPALNSIVNEIQKASTLYVTLLVQYTKVHPNVMKVSRQLDLLRDTLRQTIQSTIRALNKRKTSLNIIIQKYKKALTILPKQEEKLEQLSRNFMVNEKIYSFLLEKRAETAIIESSTVSETHIIDSATLPNKPIKPRYFLIILFGLLLGFILGIAQAVWREVFDNDIKTIDDIEKYTSIPLYGAIPMLASNGNKQVYRESLRVLATNLALLRTERKSKLITFTSSVSGEGKTSVICELGKIIAESNKKVIILDLDMRKSTLHKKCGLQNNKGMSNLLSENSKLPNVIQETQIKNLNVITSGPMPPNPTGLIMSDTLEPIINNLLVQYDYVLLDSPPIGLVADAMSLMHISDLSLIILRANYSKKEFIRNINRLNDDQDLNLGVILNGIDYNKHLGFGYAYGSDYGTTQDASYYSAKTN